MSGPLEPEVLRAILPAGVFSAEIEDCGQVVALPEAERICILSAGEKRVRDFALGRDCAHRALQRLDMPADAILRRGDGAPVWPAGVVGSITHTRGYAAAAVAPAARFLGIGVDAERVEMLNDRVARRLFLPEELAGLEGVAPEARAAFAMMLFSAKEACFKACPAGLVTRDFREIHILPGDGEFLANVGALQMRGRSFVRADLVVTVVAVRAR